MADEKIFCGSGKIVTTKFGAMTKISFSQKDLDTLQANMSNGWINLVLKEKQNKVEGKPTHYLEVDTWKPNASADTRSAEQLRKANEAVQIDITDTSDTLPF